MKPSEIIRQLEEAQDSMREAKNKLNTAHRAMEQSSVISSSTAGQLRLYVLGNFEPLIDSDHSWLSDSVNVEKIIEYVKDDTDSLDDEEDDFDDETKWCPECQCEMQSIERLYDHPDVPMLYRCTNCDKEVIR
jgi:hypothetical protein